jgi:hypothetical protein
MIVHDHHNDPNDPINRSKRIARIEHPEVEPTAVALDRRIGASLIGFMALIILGGLIVTLFDMMTDPIVTTTDSNTSRTTTGVGHSSPLTSLPKR